MRRSALTLAVVLAFASAASAAEPQPERAVARLWRALSSAPGAAADVRTLRALFHPQAVVFGASFRGGEPVLERLSAADWLRSYAEPEPEGLSECEVSRRVERNGRFATAYSVVESRMDPDAQEADSVGVNGIHLYLEGDRWRILSLYYGLDVDGDAVAPPAVSGKCLK